MIILIVYTLYRLVKMINIDAISQNMKFSEFL